MNKLIPIERIESRIFTIRGQKVMIDRDLAQLYGVKTFVLNQAVKRNSKRFPPDFMFSLTRQEIMNISQFVISSDGKENWSQIATTSNSKSHIVMSSLPAGKAGWGGRRTLPYAFTENGVAMLSSVLRSDRAIEVNIQIMRAFTRLRKVLAANKDLSYLFKELKQKVNQHDLEIGIIMRAIEKMISTDKPVKGKIGFVSNKL